METKRPSFILSGGFRVGDVGEETPLKDINENELRVGDIVTISNVDEFGIRSNCGLSAVVSDKWTTYSNGTHIEKEGDVEYYVMGLKTVDLAKSDSKWIVERVKSFEDVVSGEHWPAYGFNYI